MKSFILVLVLVAVCAVSVNGWASPVHHSLSQQMENCLATLAHVHPEGLRHKRWAAPSGHRGQGWASPNERAKRWAMPSGHRAEGWASPNGQRAKRWAVPRHVSHNEALCHQIVYGQ